VDKKNIVVCYDGTGNEYGSNNTNVVHVFESILRNENQIAFYDPGVGTFSVLGRTLGKKVGILLGKAFGVGLQQNIEDGYEYLMNRYKPGDKIFLFGFSRGAFTARALAGLLYNFGLLQKGSKNLIPYVSKMYNNMRISRFPQIKSRFFVDDKRKVEAINFKRTFCQDCKPHFIGVWDTVASLGHFMGKKFFDTELNEDVKYAYQAISIDEKRKKFPVSLWDENKTKSGQVIDQVWFAGAHSDVGGSYKERHLSDIAFAWMMDKASKCGLKLRNDWQNILAQKADGKIHDSRKDFWFWRLWKPVERKISEGSKIHQSVFDRKAKVNYHPILPKQCVKVNNPTYQKLASLLTPKSRKSKIGQVF
jgi:uncharacterized protein (DUF2235 family)